MLNLKNLFVIGAVCTAGLLACNVDKKGDGGVSDAFTCPAPDDAGTAAPTPNCVTDDAGVANCTCDTATDMGTETDGTPGPAQPKDTYQYIIIKDVSEAANVHGGPGVDICGISFTCPGGKSGTATAAVLTAGEGEFCQKDVDLASGESCSATRNDQASAVGAPEAACDPTPNADGSSKYVSLGKGGTLVLTANTAGGDLLPGGLAGCTITVVEATGSSETENYTLDVCADAAGADCHPCLGALGGEGNKDFPIPAMCN